jgi:CubicO group peptidase (beta-lactamase class C family)
MQSGFRLLGRADISRRDAFALILKTGLALKTATLPLNSFAQTATIPVTGKTVVELEGFDNLLIRYLRQNPSVPGASLAIARNGLLIYARGFGYSDLETRGTVQPDSRFRIASVSKTFTSAAIMLLVQRGRLKLTDQAFPLLDLTMPFGEKSPLDSRLNSITVHQLLCHTGGWSRNLGRNPYETWTGFDPMFYPVQIAKSLGVASPASPTEIVRFMLTRPLDFDPGSRYAYSNFGYCVLGRIIEKVSGTSYDEFVCKEIFHTLGIEDVVLGKSLLSQRASREVRYYPFGDKSPNSKSVYGGPDVQWCYGGFDLEAMDSHGGWIASLSSLVRFGASLEIPTRAGALNADSIEQLVSRPAETGIASNGVDLASYYGYGWHVDSTVPRGRSEWHDGLFTGTSAFLMRRADGVVWAVTFNTESDDSKRVPAEVIAPQINLLADSIVKWPAQNI